MDIPGKACGPCTMCKVLEIDALKKSAGPYCPSCRRRPRRLRDSPKSVPRLRMPVDVSPQLRPDKVGALLMEDADSEEHAVCDPARPLAWRKPLVVNHLVAIAKADVVKAKAGVKAWRIHASGECGPCT